MTATRAQASRLLARRPRVRRSVVLGLLLGLLPALVLTGGPALADVPVGWTEPDGISLLHGLTVYVFIPVGCILAIALLAAAPGIIKGEGILGPQPTENQWLGGPRASHELQSGDAERSTGGASGNW